jgi:hypothetical protein
VQQDVMIGVVQMRGVLHARIAPIHRAYLMSIRVLGRGLQVRHHLPFRERLFCATNGTGM